MTDQPTHRPDSQGHGEQGSGNSPAGYQPPQFVPPQGSGTPVPPAYDQGRHGQQQYGQQQYQYGQASNQFGQPSEQYGPPYAQPDSPYGQAANTYAQAASLYGQPSSPYGQAPSPYGQPAYYGMPVEPKGLSITSMVCGLVSVILGWFLLPQIAAIITGHLALRREPSGKGMSITGLVLGYLCLLGYGGFWLLIIVLAASSGSYSY